MGQESDAGVRLKRLRLRAWRRGTKEMDLILGMFADKELAAMPPEEVDQFEAILEEQDADLMNWVTGKAPVPEALDTPLFRRIAQFKHVDLGA